MPETLHNNPINMRKSKAVNFRASYVQHHLRGFPSDRYGDRCPQSIPAKIFAMVWFLVGLIIFAIFMGSLASTLTVTVVKMDSGGVGVGVTDDRKVMNVL